MQETVYQCLDSHDNEGNMKLTLNGCEVSKETLRVVTEFTKVEGMTATDGRDAGKAEKLFVTDDGSIVSLWLNPLKFSSLFITKNETVIFAGFVSPINFDGLMQSVYTIRRSVLVSEFDHLSSVLKKNKHSLVFENYLETYNFNIADSTHNFVKINGRDFRTFIHIISPLKKEKKPKWVLLNHGYLDHGGSNIKLIKHLVSRNYSVICPDLIGHGISDGERWHIDDFSQYTQSLYEVVKWMNRKLKGDFYFIGHSTGTSGLTEGFLNPKTAAKFNKVFKRFSGIFYIAPLVRSYMWELSKFSVRNLSGIFKLVFNEKLPRLPDKATSDKKYNEANTTDLLSGKYAPISWAKALINWNERNIYYGKSEQKIIIFQGDLDEVVDYEYNIPYLESKFSSVTVHKIKNSKHSIQNEIGEPAEIFYNLINKYYL